MLHILLSFLSLAACAIPNDAELLYHIVQYNFSSSKNTQLLKKLSFVFSFGVS